MTKPRSYRMACCSPATRPRSSTSASAQCSCWLVRTSGRHSSTSPCWYRMQSRRPCGPRADAVAKMPRYARTDLEINGVIVNAGELVLLEIWARATSTRRYTSTPTGWTLPGRRKSSHLRLRRQVLPWSATGAHRTADGVLPNGFSVPNVATRGRSVGADRTSKTYWQAGSPHFRCDGESACGAVEMREQIHPVAVQVGKPKKAVERHLYRQYE